MRQIISFEMKRYAEYLVFAAGLTIEKLSHIIESLEDIVNNDKNFDIESDQPLTLNKKGQNELRKIDPIFVGKTLINTIKSLDKAISDSVTENPDLRNLNIYLQRTLRHSAGKWINTAFTGKNFEENKKIFLNSVLKPITTAINSLTLTPRTRPWEKETEPPSGMSQEDYDELLKREEIGPGEDFDPHKRPPAIKPEKVLERR